MTNIDDKLKKKVWEKGKVVNQDSKDTWRKDDAGAWINFDLYGKQVEYGWQVDHIYPKSKGGGLDLVNLQPLHWENNNSKDDDYPVYNTVKTAHKSTNIDQDQLFVVEDSIQMILANLYNI